MIFLSRYIKFRQKSFLKIYKIKVIFLKSFIGLRFQLGFPSVEIRIFPVAITLTCEFGNSKYRQVFNFCTFNN